MLLKEVTPTSIRIDSKLMDRIREDAKREKRSLTAQIEYNLEKYYSSIYCKCFLLFRRLARFLLPRCLAPGVKRPAFSLDKGKSNSNAISSAAIEKPLQHLSRVLQGLNMFKRLCPSGRWTPPTGRARALQLIYI